MAGRLILESFDLFPGHRTYNCLSVSRETVFILDLLMAGNDVVERPLAVVEALFASHLLRIPCVEGADWGIPEHFSRALEGRWEKAGIKNALRGRAAACNSISLSLSLSRLLACLLAD